MTYISHFFSQCKRFIQAEWGLVIVLLLLAVIVSQNWFSDTWLTGWDTLHPEFNLPLNTQRVLEGSWRADQGLGTIAAHAHMSELPRILTLWFLEFVAVPQHSVRLVYILSCFVIGPLGIYTLSKWLAQKDLSSEIASGIGLVSAVVYFSNLTLVQQFSVVFEMFAVQYAALGWLLFFSWRYLLTKKSGATHRWLALFFITSFLSAPMAYAPIFWFVCAGLLLSTWFLTIFTNFRSSRVHWKRFFVLIFVLLSSNAFWLFHTSYYLLSGSDAGVSTSLINRVFSPDAFASNEGHGNPIDILIQKNFLFDWIQYDAKNNTFSLLLQTWQNHISNPLVLFLGVFLGMTGIIGVSAQFTHFKHWFSQSKKNTIFQNISLEFTLIPFFLLSLVMLINSNVPIEQLFDWFRNHSQLFSEALRFPYTKFSIVFAALLALGSGFLLHELSLKITGNNRTRIMRVTCLALCSVALIWIWPIFTGNLFSDLLKKDIPAEYFTLFSYFKTQPKTDRVLYLPAHTADGWLYTNWGYEGPGFIWFGIEQPFLTRDFDRWNPYNERVYRELRNSIQEENSSQFLAVLQKYDVRFLLLDASVRTADTRELEVHTDILKKLLASNGLKQDFSSGFLQVFTVPQASEHSGKDLLSSDTHPLSDSMNPYVFDTHAKLDDGSLTYTFTASGSAHVAAQTNMQAIFILSKSTPSATGSYVLTLKMKSPSLVQNEKSSPLFTQTSHTITIPGTLKNPQLIIGDTLFKIDSEKIEQEILAQVPIGETYTVKVIDATNTVISSTAPEIVPTRVEITSSTQTEIAIPVLAQPVLFSAAAQSCDPVHRGTQKSEHSVQEVKLFADGAGSNCISTLLPYTDSVTSFLEIKSTNISGRKLKISVQNTKKEVLLREQLDGYSLFPLAHSRTTQPLVANIENKSYGAVPAENTIEAINQYALGISDVALESLTIDHVQENIPEENIRTVSSNRFVFFTQSPNTTKSVLILLQSYHQGWIAFPSWKIWQQFEHQEIDGWKNAWVIENTQKGTSITLLFWPQLLSFFGLFIGLATFLGGMYTVAQLELQQKRSKKLALLQPVRKRLFGTRTH